jgi:hypothetical protein
VAGLFLELDVILRSTIAGFLVVACGMGCDKSAGTGAGDSSKSAPAAGAAASTEGAKNFVKLSQYDGAEYCDLAAGSDGTLHAIYTERPVPGKPVYLYYRASHDGGTTWSEAKNLSDDESGNAASFCRIVLDGKGRIYAIWKYVGANTILDGPGGTSNGIITCRCLDGGTWSKPTALNDKKSAAAFSWFPALGPGGVVHVIWSAVSEDAVRVQGWGSADYADLVQDAALDGANAGQAKALIAPQPLPTKEQIDAAHAAHKDISYEDQRPKRDGFLNLRGYIDAGGIVHFIAEDPGLTKGPNGQPTGKRIVLWDGKALLPVYEYERFQTYNNFNDPPALLVDGKGAEHVIRAPEKSEKASVRDYTVQGGAWGDPVDVASPKNAKGTILHWQAMQLPAGKMAVTVSLSEKGGWAPDDAELMFATSDGAGKWTAPQRITDNAGQQSFMHKETGGGNAVSTSNTFRPRFASVVMGKDGHPCLLMVNVQNTILGITNAGITSSGRAVSALSTGSTDSPMVFFVKL